MEGHAEAKGWMARQGPQELARRDVPERDLAVLVRLGDDPAIVAERHAEDRGGWQGIERISRPPFRSQSWIVPSQHAVARVDPSGRNARLGTQFACVKVRAGSPAELSQTLTVPSSLAEAIRAHRG